MTSAPRSMRYSHRLLLIVAALSLGACRDDAPEAATPNPPVAVWTPDSSTAAPADSGGVTPAAPDSADTAPGADASSPGATPEGATSTGGTGQAEEPAPTAPPPAAPATSRDEATRILLRAESAYDAVRTLQAEFVQDLSVPLLESTQRSRGTIFHRKPDRFLMRFSDPQGDVVVADGEQVWLYYPSNDPGQVVRTSSGQAGRLDLQREFLSNPTERFNATLEGSEVVAGRPARVLRLVPRQQSPYRQVRLWIDDQDALARRFEITESNDAVRTVELRNLRVNATLPDDLFVFTPPAGVQIFDQ